jgi:DNA-binding IclR family transcriptional regulator
MSDKRHTKIPDRTEPEKLLASDEHWVLRWLVRMPLLRVADLRACTQISQSSLYRLLARLQERGWVEAVSPAALAQRSCRCYYLSNRGISRLAQVQGVDPVTLAREAGADERGLLRLLPRLPELIALQEVLWEVCLSAPEHLTYAGERSAIAWHVLRDYIHELPGADHALRCPVSALLLLRQRRMVPRYPDAMRQEVAEHLARAEEHWYDLQIIMDSPLLDIHAIHTWLTRLERIQASISWFPPLLILVATPERMALWHDTMRHLRRAKFRSFLTAALAVYPQPERTIRPGNIWRWGWQRIGTQAPCHLHDLLQPHSSHEIPADVMVTVSQSEQLVREYAPHHAKAQRSSSFAHPHQPLVITGHFTRRVIEARSEQRLLALPVSLASLCLSSQAIRLLTQLEQAPFLNHEELAVFAGLRPASVSRTLSQLAREGWLHQAHDLLPGSRQENRPRWVLSARGVRALARRFHLPQTPRMVTHTTTTGEQVWLPQKAAALLSEATWSHQQGIYVFFTRLAAHTSDDPMVPRLHWWSQQGGRRFYLWQKTTCLLSPDATAEVGNEEHTLQFWLEYAAGDPAPRDFTRLLRGYSTYLRSRAWMGEQRPLPALCVLVQESSHEQRLARLVTQAQEQLLGCHVAVTTMSRAQARGGFAPIWWPLSPSAASTTGERVCMLDL